MSFELQEELTDIKHLLCTEQEGFKWITPFDSKQTKRSIEYSALECLRNATHNSQLRKQIAGAKCKEQRV